MEILLGESLWQMPKYNAHQLQCFTEHYISTLATLKTQLLFIRKPQPLKKRFEDFETGNAGDAKEEKDEKEGFPSIRFQSFGIQMRASASQILLGANSNKSR